MAISSLPSMTPAELAIDMPKVQAFMGRLMGDLSSAAVCLICLLGDRLGLFKALAGQGPATSLELAQRAGVSERYAREWLAALASAGYLEYAPASQRFSLPPEHALALAWEGNPLFLAGAYQQLAGLAGPLDALTQAFRDGRGVPDSAYPDDLRAGMERISAGWFDHLLVQEWIACLPDVQARLTHGAWVADVGCGGGRALVNLARAFPNSRFVGFDSSAAAVARAAANARAAGVADRVRVEQRDAVEGLPRQFDLITAFDMLHDVREPRRLLAAIRHALAAGGSLLLSEIKSSEKLEANAGPVGSILYATSVLYCLPTSLANGAEGLGTMGLPESMVRALCEAAGLGQVRRLPIEHPFNVLYQATP